jgi:hypothetical protein
VSAMGDRRSDRWTAPAKAGTTVTGPPEVGPKDVLVVESSPVAEEDEPLGWLISLLVESNANEDAAAEPDPA